MTTEISGVTKSAMNLSGKFKVFLDQIKMLCEIEIDKFENKYNAILTGADAHFLQFFSQNLDWEIESGKGTTPPKVSISKVDQNKLINCFTQKMLANEQGRLFNFYLAKSLILKLENVSEQQMMASAIGFNLGMEFSKLISDFNRNDIDPGKIFEILVRNHLNKMPATGTKELTLSLMDVKTFEKLQMNYFGEVFLKGSEELSDSKNIFYFKKDGSETSTSYGTIENIIGIVKSAINRK